MATVTWTGAVSDDWNDPLNWVGGTGVPTSSDAVVINSGNPVLSTGFLQIGPLVIGSEGALTISGSAFLTSAALDNAGRIEVSATDSSAVFQALGLNGSGLGDVNTVSAGVFILDSSHVTLSDLTNVTNAGRLLITRSTIDLQGGNFDLTTFGRVQIDSTVVSNGTLICTDATSPTLNYPTFDGLAIHGDLSLRASPGINIVNGLTGQSLDGTGPAIITVAASSPSVPFVASVNFQGDQTIENTTFNLYGVAAGDVALTSTGGTTTFAASTTLNVISNGTTMSGVFASEGDINVASRLSIAGQLDVTGALTNQAGGRINVFSGGSLSDTDFVNNGIVDVQGGKASLLGSLTGTGLVSLQAGASVTIGTADASQTVSLIDGRLTLTSPQGFDATIDDFKDGSDVIDLANVHWDAGDTVTLLAGNVLEITQVEDGSTIRLQLDPEGNYGGVPYQLVDNGDGGTDIVVTCFCRGTLIATPAGQRPVEELAAGDEVLTAGGEPRVVLWIGRQSVAAAFAEPLLAYPVRIAAGALATGIPARDLRVSPDHALLVEGLLVQAGALVNGTSITRPANPEPHFTYYHIELEDHALVLAEGAPAESFVDNVTRRRFDNHAEYQAAFGDSRAGIAELELPRVKSARQLPASIRQRIEARIAEIGVAAAA